MKHLSGNVLASFVAIGMAVTGLAARAEDLKVGVVMATTGTYAFVGATATKGALLAAEDLNAAKYFDKDTMTVIAADDGSNPTQAATLIHRMALQDKVLIVIGPVSTSESMSVGPIAGELKMPIFTTGTATAITAIGPWVFRVGEKASYLYTPLADYAVDKLKVKRCYSVTIRDNQGYGDQTAAFNGAATKRGVSIVGEESILAADTDFAALATKIVYAKPDCLFLSTPPEQGANLVIQAKQAGMPADVKLFGNIGMSSINYIKTGGKAIDGTCFPAQFVSGGFNELGKQFVANYAKKYGSAPDDWAAVGYTMMEVAAHAVKEARPNATPEKVREAMANTKDVPVVAGQGKFSIDATREPFFGGGVMTIRDGQFAAP
jgi:branched-chain amino acid transport system substrate-binding protein